MLHLLPVCHILPTNVRLVGWDIMEHYPLYLMRSTLILRKIEHCVTPSDLEYHEGGAKSGTSIG